MRIAVCVAAVPDPERVQWDRLRGQLDLAGAEPILNPIDRNALEVAAVLAKQTGVTFTALCAGTGASAALREAAAFGAERLVAIAGAALDGADEVRVAQTLSAGLRHLGGFDVIICGAYTASFGSGTVPGIMSTQLDGALLAGVLSVDTAGDAGRCRATVLSGDGVWKVDVALPAVFAAAPYGIGVRSVPPLVLMKAARRPIESLSLDALEHTASPASSGVRDGGFEPARGKRAAAAVEGDDAAAKASWLAGALRERGAI